MKTIAQVPLELVEVEFIPEKSVMEFGKLYYSKEYKTTNHLCPCGCGQITPIPIKEGAWCAITSKVCISATAKGISIGKWT